MMSGVPVGEIIQWGALGASLSVALAVPVARASEALICRLDAWQAGEAGEFDGWDILGDVVTVTTTKGWLRQVAFGLAAAGAIAGFVACFAGAGVALAFVLGIILALAIMGALIDRRSTWLPDLVTGPLLWLALISSAAGVWPVPVADAIFGACVTWGLFKVADAIGRPIYGESVIAGGDVKLAAAAGAISGFQGLPMLMGSLAVAAFVLGVWVKASDPTRLWVPIGPAISFALGVAAIHIVLINGWAL